MALVGSQGIRALTHGRVDEHAGLPRGSTSNHFRTRAALVAGVAEWIADREPVELPPSASEPTDAATIEPVDDLIDRLTTVVNARLAQRREFAMARFAIFVEAARDPEVRERLVANRQRYLDSVEVIFRALGAAEPVVAARTAIACVDGLMLHRVTVEDHVDVRASIAQAVHGALAAHAGVGPAER